MTQIETRHELDADPKSFKEPFSGELYDRAYGAMPANPFLNDEVKARQAEIEASFMILFKHPPKDQKVPESFRRFFIEDYEIGERRRQMTNVNGYVAWRSKSPIIPGFLVPQITRYESARAEINDVIDIALYTDAAEDGLEAGRVTVPYGRRMEFVPLLRRDTADSIESHGGVLEPRISPYRSIDIIPHVTDGKIDAFLAKYKHDIGTITRDDGKVVRIVERQIVGIRVDEASGFRQDIIKRMQLIPSEIERFEWDNTNDRRFEWHLRETGCRGFIEKAIQLDSTEPYIVPESTTVYLFTEDPTTTSRSLGGVAFRSPDRDDGIAYYNSTNPDYLD